MALTNLGPLSQACAGQCGVATSDACCGGCENVEVQRLASCCAISSEAPPISSTTECRCLCGQSGPVDSHQQNLPEPRQEVRPADAAVSYAGTLDQVAIPRLGLFHARSHATLPLATMLRQATLCRWLT
ncbi:MAG: hypothetical protein WD045_10240 [Pirellulaceae bacterium]